MASEECRGVRVPPELHAVPPRPLEEYARARVLQFSQVFAARLNPTVSPQVVQQAALDCLQALPPADYSGVALEQRDLQLVFRHDCLSLGCLDAQCVLCEHNPHRRCSVNFSPKYLVNDVLKAKCEAPIRVELIDRATGHPIGEDLTDVVLEMCVLDGNTYDQKVVEAGEEREDDLEACALLLNNKAQALLQTGPGASHNANSKVQMALTKGVAVLPDLHVSDSSEAMLSGRKPPFRLLVKALHLRGQPINIRHAVSEGFVVATRRTRTAGKVEIPNVDDHISKLEHMGKETVKKLQDIRGSATASGMEVAVPDNTINKVGEFRRLALMAEADGHLRQKLQQVLKLSKEKWEEARDHAMRAVVADNRMRIWYADKASMEVGLLFTCRLGDVDLERPVGLLTKKAQEGAQTTMEATLMAQQTPSQRDQVRALQPQAVTAWWQQGHPGWAIYPVDSEQFLATGTLDSVTLPLPGETGYTAPPSPSAAAAMAAAAGTGPPSPHMPSAAFNPAIASAFMGAAMPNDALMRAMGSFMQQGGHMPGALAAMQPFMLGAAGPPPGMMPSASGREGSPRDVPAMPAVPAMPPQTSAFATAAAQNGGPAAANGPAGGAAGAGTGADATPFAAANLMPPPPPVGKSSGGSGGGGQLGSGGLGMAPSLAPSLNLAGLSGLFGGDLSRLPHLAGQFNLANFPSMPAGMMSGDLEALLAQSSMLPPSEGAPGLFGGAGARAYSFNMSSLGSLNLPDEVIAAMQIQMERAAGGSGSGGGGTGQRQPSQQLQAATAAAAAAATGGTPAGKDQQPSGAAEPSGPDGEQDGKQDKEQEGEKDGEQGGDPAEAGSSDADAGNPAATDAEAAAAKQPADSAEEQQQQRLQVPPEGGKGVAVPGRAAGSSADDSAGEAEHEAAEAAAELARQQPQRQKLTPQKRKP